MIFISAQHPNLSQDHAEFVCPDGVDICGMNWIWNGYSCLFGRVFRCLPTDCCGSPEAFYLYPARGWTKHSGTSGWGGLLGWPVWHLCSRVTTRKNQWQTLLFPFVLGVWSISTSAAADWHRCSTKLGHPSNLFIWFLWGIWHYISGRIFPIYRLNSINQLLRCYYLKKKETAMTCRIIVVCNWESDKPGLLFGNVIDRWRPFYGICLEFARPINVVSS